MNDKKHIELEEAMKALKYANERYRIASEHSNEIILDYDIATNSIYYATTRVETIYGLPQNIDNAPEYLVKCGVVLQESAAVFYEMFQKIKAGVPQASCVIKTRTKAGKEVWDEVILTTVFSADGRPTRAIGVFKDINQQMEAQQQYQKEMLYRNVVKKYALISYEADLTHGKVLSGLDSFFEEIGETYKEAYDEAFRLLVKHLVWSEDQEFVYQNFCMEHVLQQYHKGLDKMEVEYRRAVNGQAFWVRCTVYLTYDQQLEIVHAFYYIHDIHKTKMEEMKLRANAELDLLTGIYNKGTMEQLIRQALAKDFKEGCVNAFLIVDLDDFKNVNDQLGHAFGDAVLFETAQNLKSLCRIDGIAGRIGGDEFAIFLKNLPSSEIAEAKGRNICAMFQNAYVGVLKNHKVSGTVGISLFPDHGTTFEELYDKADIALYHAKKYGKDTYCMYCDDLETKVEPHKSTIDEGKSFNKMFSENIIEYILRILYESKDLEQAVQAVVELIAKYYNFTRAYVYEMSEEKESCIMLYEWCQTNVLPLPGALRVISGDLLHKYRQRFAQKDTFVRYSAESLFQEESSCKVLEGIFSRVQYPLGNAREMLGMIGFDKYYPAKAMNADELTEMKSVLQILDIFLTERQHNTKLLKSGAMLQAVADSHNACTYIIDPETYVLQFINQNTRNMLPAAVPGSICYRSIRDRHAPCIDCPFTAMAEEGTTEYNAEMYLDPYHLWAKIHASIINVGNDKEYALFNGYDFTKYKKQAEGYIVDADAFTRDVALYRALCHSTDDYIFMCDMPKNLFYFPQLMVEEFGLPGQVIEDAIPLWSSMIHESERAYFLNSMQNIMEGKENYHDLEYRVRNRENKWVWLRCRGYMEVNEAGKPRLFAGVVTNLGKKRKIDYLTGLPNKYEFELNVRSYLSESPEKGQLLLLGLDNFRNINNLYGWEYGDRIIHESAQKLQALLPQKIQIYRLDGDCFGVYFHKNSKVHAEEAFKILGQVFEYQQQCGEHRYYCTISGGYSEFGKEPISFNTLFKQAEFALEYSKIEGKNRLSRYNMVTMGDKERILTMLEHLRESVDYDCRGFELYFQPQIKTDTRVVRSAEVLLRWHSEEYGLVSPVEFIPLLEQSGLIQKVGRWVLINASRVCHEWRKKNPEFILNVNVSFAQLQDKSFIPYMEHAVMEGLIDPNMIHLELTESCIAAGSSSLIAAFGQLRTLGFCIEMDDFGTGYSSLEILKNAPADVVKIDRAFVSDITKSNFDATFIEFVVALCHSVDIKVCLEGVETWEEYRMVELMAVDIIQGFLFGRPQTKLEFEMRYLMDNGMEFADVTS